MRAALLALAASLVPTVAAAGPGEELTQALALYEDYQPELAAPRFARLAADPGLPDPSRARAALYLGLCKAILGDEAGARAAFRQAFGLDPVVAVPSGTLPSIAALADAAQARAEAARAQATKEEAARAEAARAQAEREAAERATAAREKAEREAAERAEATRRAAQKAEADRKAAEERQRRERATLGNRLDGVADQAVAAIARLSGVSYAPRPPPPPPPEARPEGEGLAAAPPPEAEPEGVKAKADKVAGQHSAFGVGLGIFGVPEDARLGPLFEIFGGSERAALRWGAVGKVYLGDFPGLAVGMRLEGGPRIGPVRLTFGADLEALFILARTLIALDVQAHVIGVAYETEHLRVVAHLFTPGVILELIPATMTRIIVGSSVGVVLR